MNDDYENPPHSRLFITGTFCTEENDFRKEFEIYGNVESVAFIKQKDNGKSKGIAFVKFSKASEAALAMEGLNHKSILDCFRPITVKIAQDKPPDGRTQRVINEDDRIMRLFIIVPPQEDETSVKEHFSQYGELRKVTFIPDKHRRGSNPPRTFAFVKYYKASDAAKALEECDSRYKAIFAKPQFEEVSSKDEKDSGYGRHRPGRYPDNDSNNKRMRGNGDQGNSYDNFSPMKKNNQSGYNPLMLMMMNKMSSNPFFPQDMMMGGMQYPNMGMGGAGELIVKTKIPINVTSLAQLFNIIPGMESCVPDTRSNGTMFNIMYSSPRAASYAFEKLQGFEYPPNMPIAIVCNFVNPDSQNYSNPMATGFMDMFGTMGSMMNAGDMSGGMVDNMDPQEEFCNVPLPPSQPMAPKTSNTKERLWVMGYPKIPPVPALMDAFGRFGNLLAVIPSKDRNYCFVHYAENSSAMDALHALDKSVICGAEMKVVIADPQNNNREGGHDDSSYHHLHQSDN